METSSPTQYTPAVVWSICSMAVTYKAIDDDVDDDDDDDDNDDDDDIVDNCA
jgi:hypothetical protein